MQTSIADLAAQFGRRLHVTTIGFVQQGEDFAVLESMAHAARDFGSGGAFFSPTLDPEALGLVISTLN